MINNLYDVGRIELERGKKGIEILHYRIILSQTFYELKFMPNTET